MDLHDKTLCHLREKYADWKDQLYLLSPDPSVADTIRLSNERQILAAQVFSFLPPGPPTQAKYSKLDQFAAQLRHQLTECPHKALIKLLASTEKQISYLLSEILWGELAEKVKKGCLNGGNCTFDWERYLDSGLNPTELKKDFKLVLNSANSKLLNAFKEVLDPADPQLFSQTLAGPEASGKFILPLLRPSHRHVRVTKVNPANLPYLPLPLPTECHRSLVTACIDYLLQCPQPVPVLQALEKYLGVSRSSAIAKAMDRIFNLHPSKQNLPLLREALRGQQNLLNRIIVTTADRNLPLGKDWQKFLVQESKEFTLLPLMVMHEPDSWNLLTTSLSTSDLQRNLQNTLLPSLQHSVVVKSWDTFQDMLELANKTICYKNDHASPSMAAVNYFPTPSTYEEVPWLEQDPPVTCLRLLARLRTSPPRAIRDQLITQGLLKKNQAWIQLGKKTSKVEQAFIEEHVCAETTPPDLAYFAQHLPYQRKLLLETFLRRLSSKGVGTVIRPTCSWFKDKEQVSILEKLALETVSSFPESQEVFLTYLVRCNLIQHMPALAPLLFGQHQLLQHASEENLQYLLKHDAYTGIKPKLDPLLHYHDPLKVVPLLLQAGIELDDHEFWCLAGKANENVRLLPLIRKLLEYKPPKTVDSDTLAELSESSLIAMLLEFRVLQPTDTLDGRPMLEWLDREDLFEVLCRINLGTDHPILVDLAAREPETAWQIVQKTIQTTQSRENLSPQRKQELELF
jgi:hypothetical protein